MDQSLLTCPLCSCSCFPSAKALCLSLIHVSSKTLCCALCKEELHGLDKLTIHLLTHFLGNEEFKNFFTNEHPVSVQTGKTHNSTSEPLNLIKPVSVAINEASSKQTNKYTTSSSQQELTNRDSTVNEKPNLIIDDEVMLVFNKKSGFETEKEVSFNISHDLSCCVTGSNAEDQECGVNSIKPPDTCNKITSLSETNCGLSLTNEMFDSSLRKENENSYSSKRVDFTSDLKYNALLRNSSRDISDTVDKDILSINTPTTLDNCRQENYEIEKKSCDKNTFLSPKGERVVGYRCDICSLVFPEEKIMLMHRQLIHVDISEDLSKVNKFKCHLCSKSFVMRGSLMVHMRVAHFGGAVVARLIENKQLERNAVSGDLAQFVCSVCNKGFRKEHQLTQHEKLHDGKQCDVCFKTFTTKYFLRKHKRLHTGEMPYTCNICSKSFTFQQSYHKHLLYHSDDKPYSCAECGRAFKELSTLHNHQRIHTGEKPFSCESCGKCFRQRVSYLVHRRIHTGVLPYKCETCGKKFRYKVSERTHKCSKPLQETGSSELTLSKESSKGGESLVLPQENSNPNLSFLEMSSESGEGKQESTEGRSEGFPEPADLLSLVMSPTDRMQHLSLSADSPQTIDSEELKQLLYDVGDYSGIA